jgi:cell division protein FtsL
MQWFELPWLSAFENPLLIFVIAVVLMVILIIIFITFLTFFSQQRKHQLAIKQRIHHYLVYRINLKLDIVYEFDPKHPGQDKLIPVSQFLKKFQPSDAEKIYQWWEKLLRSKLDTPWILTTKSMKKKQDSNRQLIFEIIKIDETKQTIHFHQYGLKYLKPNLKKISTKQLVISSQQAFDVVKKLPVKQGAFISIFMMFPGNGLDEQFKYFYLSQCKEKLIPYLSPQLLLIDTANDILVLATKSLETHEYMQIAQSLFRVISQYVEVNALESLIKFNLALIEHKHFPNDLGTLRRKSKELHQIMMKKKLTVLAYEKHQPVAQTLEKNETIFADDFYRQLKFNFLYRPLVNQPEIDVIGQQVMIQPNMPTALNTFELLKEVPIMMEYTKEFYRRYLSLIQQSLTLQQGILLTPFSLTMKLQELLPEIKNLTAADQLVVLLDENEINEIATTEISLKTWADPLKRVGVHFAIAVDDMTPNMEDPIYQFFDYLVIDYKRIINVENNQKTSIQLKSIFQNFSRFEKPFVVIDMLSEASLELLPLKHVKILGADWIMGFQSKADQLTKRQVAKIKNLINKQEQYHGKTN